MNSRGKAIWAAGGLIIIALGTVLYLSNREPAYQGKPISYWVDQFRGATSFVQIRDSQIAFHQIGPTGVPYILGRIKSDHSELRRL